MNFKSWGNYNKLNEEFEEKIYPKTALKKMKLKPSKLAIPQYHKVRVQNTWKEFEFFTLEQTVEIKEKKPINIREYDMTVDNICEALYIINKSAKRSRDTKARNYNEGNHGHVKKAKIRQQELYELKENVINKLLKEKRISLEGFHKQFNNTLLYYKYKDYGFHIIDNDMDTSNIKLLGSIDDIITSEKRKHDMKFCEANNLLISYLKEKHKI